MKNNEKLLYTIGEVKDKSVPDVPEKKPKILWIKLSAAFCGVAAAALLGIVIIGGGFGEKPPTFDPVTEYDPQQTPDISEDSETTPEPVPPVSEAVTLYPEFSYEPEFTALVPFSANIGSSKGAGAEGVGAYNDVSGLREILSQNPWNESMEFETLPVYHNLLMDNWLGRSGGGVAMYLSEEQMTEMAENAAYALGTEVVSTEVQSDVYLEGLREPPTPEQVEAASHMPYNLIAQCADGTEIQVDGGGHIRVEFDPPIQLPEYSLDISERKQETTELLVGKFNNLLQFKNPQLFTSSPDVDNSVYIYDNTGSDVQRILNYSLYNARFYAYEDGDLDSFYIDNPLVAAEYMGDYPVITLDEAREMLLEGKYLANVADVYITENTVTEENIGGVELVYRGGFEENFQPYYCFYIALDREEEFADNYPGMTYYGSFYVPAVSEEYTGVLTRWRSAPDSVPAGITTADVNDCLDIIESNSDFTAINSYIFDLDSDGSDEVLVLADVPFRAICVFKKENGKMVQTDSFGMGDLKYVDSLNKLHTKNGNDYPCFSFHYDNGGVMKCSVIAAIKRSSDGYYIEYLLSYGTLNYTDIPEPFTKEFYRIGWNKTDIAMDGDYNDITEEEFLKLYEQYMDI